MSSKHKDHKGRPVVVVTGMGAVTSLGRGKKDNWAALTAGKSGIHRIKRFPTAGLNTSIAGTVDFMDTEEISAPAISYAMADFDRRGGACRGGLRPRRFSRPAVLRRTARRAGMDAPFQADGRKHRGRAGL